MTTAPPPPPPQLPPPTVPVPSPSVPFGATVGAAVLAWIGSLFGGPLVGIAMVAVTWQHRETPSRAHAITATVIWSVLLAIYLPVFVVGIFLPSLENNSTGPRLWAVVVAIVIALTSWICTAAGLLVVHRQYRRGAWPTDGMRDGPRSGLRELRSRSWRSSAR